MFHAISVSVLLRSVGIGILATIVMDVLSVCALRLRWIAPLPPRLIGRWFAQVARGQVVHKDIGDVAPIRHEMVIALPVHYTIGATLALVYVFVSTAVGLSPRNLLAALVFASSTNVLPWLLMFPAMGYGWFGAHGPPKTRLLFSSLVNHGFYGLGLWLGSLILS
jgi:hypothetical protein